MITKHNFTNTTWVELDQPTDDDIRSITGEYGIPPIVARDLKAVSFKQRIETYGNFLYLVLHFPAFKHTHGEKHIQELDFIIGANFVITVKYDTIDPLHKFSKLIETDHMLGKKGIHEEPAFIFFGLLREIYRSLGHEIEYIEDWTDKIEQKIFKSKEKEMVIALSQVTRELLDFKRTIEPHKEILDSLGDAGTKIFDGDFSFNVDAIRTDYYKVRHHMRSSIELVQALRETNDSLLTTKQNEVMKLFTILAFVTFPLSLIAAIFDIQSTSTPFQNHPYGFWIILFIMCIATLIMFAFFKHKKWL